MDLKKYQSKNWKTTFRINLLASTQFGIIMSHVNTPRCASIEKRIFWRLIFSKLVKKRSEKWCERCALLLVVFIGSCGCPLTMSSKSLYKSDDTFQKIRTAWPATRVENEIGPSLGSGGSTENKKVHPHDTGTELCETILRHSEMGLVLNTIEIISNATLEK